MPVTKEERSRINRLNSKEERASPKFRPHIPVEVMAEEAAKAIMGGRRSPLSLVGSEGEVSKADLRVMARLTREPAEKFQELLLTRLQTIAELTGDRLIEGLQGGEGKISELAYLLSVATDKYQSLNGKSQVQTANVNVQINNYADGKLDRAALIASLNGEPSEPATTTALTDGWDAVRGQI